MGTVAIGANNYTVYGPAGVGATLADAKSYLSAAAGKGPDAWNALATDDLKSKFIVQAFRMLEVLVWQGAPTQALSVQVTQWPRSGVTDVYGQAVDSSTVPTVVVSAQYELAAQLAGDATITTQTQTGSNVHRVEAKGVGVQFFRPTNIPGVSPLLPVPVQRLIGQYLASSQRAPLSQSFSSQDPDDPDLSDFDGADSAFSDDSIMSRNGPLI